MESNAYYWQGEKVRLRSWEADDWEHDRRWQMDSEGARLAGYVQLPRSEAELRKQADDQSLRRPGDGAERCSLVIETLTGEAAGVISANIVDQLSGSFFYGLYVSPDARRQGYASEAVLLLVRYYFLERRFQRSTPKSIPSTRRPRAYTGVWASNSKDGIGVSCTPTALTTTCCAMASQSRSF